MKRYDIINTLIEANGYQSYLEIGLSNPSENFIKIKCEHKESVDPYNKSPHDITFDSDELIKECLTYRMTSDEMFRRMPRDKKYDIIFIDGLHEFHQVARDITNSFKHLNPGGLIVIHDSIPQCEDDTIDKQQPGRWMGSVYKTVIQLEGLIPLYYSVDEQVGTEVGITILTYFYGCDAISVQPKWVSYEYYEQNKAKLNIKTLDVVLISLKEWHSAFKKQEGKRL